jgi:hypothetical protein
VQTGQSLFGDKLATDLLLGKVPGDDASLIAEDAILSFCAGARPHMVLGENSRAVAMGYSGGQKAAVIASVSRSGYSLNFWRVSPEEKQLYAMGAEWAVQFTGQLPNGMFTEENAPDLLIRYIEHLIGLSPYVDKNAGIGGSVDVVKLTPEGARCLQGSFA